MQPTDKYLQVFATTEIAEKGTARSKARIYKFTGKEKHFVSLVEASVLTKKYREKAGRGAVNGVFFSRLIFEKIIAQESCIGVRNYFAALNDGTPTLVLVGVDGTGSDMIRGVLGDDAFPCPPFHGRRNLLNSDLEDYLVPATRNEVAFTGKENHSITLAEARHFVENFRKDKEEGVIKGGYFSREIYEKILSQEGCVGIRNYFAAISARPGYDNVTPTIVMVGVDSRGNDQINGVVGDDMLLCPPYDGPETGL